jgi:signal peptidase I
MIPTFKDDGNVVLVDKFSHNILHRPFQINDIVISHCPSSSDKNVCKRICGLAGDTVTFRRHPRYQLAVLQVPRGHVWLLGDNPSNSNDSRYYGPVSEGLIQGRVVIKLSVTAPFIEFVK